MNNKKKILFIINPISGVGKQKIIEQLLPQHLDTTIFEPEIVYTKAAKHAIELSRNAAIFDTKENKSDIVVAIGGDGTVNEVSQGLVGSSTIMAIIPTGSGNGLARYLKIPMKLSKAIETINSLNVKKIDTVRINLMGFVNVAGVGFDAHISHKFATYDKRGFFSYLKLIASEFWKFEDIEYIVTIDGKEYKRNVFLISFANSSTFGNNAHISPNALIDDGLLDICFLKKFPVATAPSLALRLFVKTMDRSKYSEIIQGKEINVKSTKPLVAHIDGEPVNFGNEINIKINPLSLNVIIK